MTLPNVPRPKTLVAFGALAVLVAGAAPASSSTDVREVLQPGYCATVTVQAGTPSATTVTVCRP